MCFFFRLAKTKNTMKTQIPVATQIIIFWSSESNTFRSGARLMIFYKKASIETSTVKIVAGDRIATKRPWYAHVMFARCLHDRAARISSYVRMRITFSPWAWHVDREQGSGELFLCSSETASRAILHTEASCWQRHGSSIREPRHKWRYRQRVGLIYLEWTWRVYHCCIYRTGKGQLSLWSLSSKRQIWTESCPTGVISISRPEHTPILSV